MAVTYSFRGAGGEGLIPVADGTYEVTGMSDNYTFGECYVAFYDEAGEVVQPTAGTVSFASAAIEGQYLPPPDNATINAADCGPDATYTPPSFGSVVKASKMTLSGVTGAAYVKAIHWRGK